MPAVTVDHILDLPRIAAPAPDTTARPVLGVSSWGSWSWSWRSPRCAR